MGIFFSAREPSPGRALHVGALELQQRLAIHSETLWESLFELQHHWCPLLYLCAGNFAGK